MFAMDAPYRIRLATPDDAAVIARHRVLMFYDMHEQPIETAVLIETRTRFQVLPLLESGGYIGWVVETTDARASSDDSQPNGLEASLGSILASPGPVVAGLGVIERPRLARHSNPEGQPEAYVLNVYTERGHRRRGLASELMRTMLAWCRTRGISRVSLHASPEGQLVYTRFGFKATNEMSVHVDLEP